MIVIELADCRTPACMTAGATKHRWEWERPTVRELLRVQETLGMDPDQWQEALGQAMEGLTTDALKASIMLVTVLHSRIGVPATYEEVDFDLFALQFLADPDADAAQAEDDPGKAETPASPHPGEGDPASSTSGPSSEAGSARKSSRTRRNSGDASGSP